MEQKDESAQAKNFALKRLSRRALLTQELGSMLHKAGFSQEIVETILQWCQKRGYLNDVEEIRRRVEKEQKKGVGKKAIFFKLSKKEGIDRALLEASLKELLSEKKVLMECMKKEKIDFSHFKSRQKFIAKYIRRGFCYETILEALSTIG